LTQKELGERVQLPRTSVTNIEHERQRIALHQLIQFASALGTEPLELLPNEDPNLDELVPEKSRPSLPDDEEQRKEKRRAYLRNWKSRPSQFLWIK
jgi:transcriptional regulator with XRE-family HTH domain